jgi:hypothetical protein
VCNQKDGGKVTDHIGPSLPTNSRSSRARAGPGLVRQGSVLVSSEQQELGDGVGGRFLEFSKRYPHMVNPDVALRMWLSVVTNENVGAVFECLERYKASDQWKRGVYQEPQNWLQDRARNNWADAPARAKEQPRKLSKGQIAMREILEDEMAHSRLESL